MKQILVGIQDLLDQPNPADPAQTDGYQLFIQVLLTNPPTLRPVPSSLPSSHSLLLPPHGPPALQDAVEYRRRVRLQAKQYPSLI